MTANLTPHLEVYLPVVVSARPSGTPTVAVPCASARGTVEVVSALAMVTSLALLASSPQWGQKLWPFSTEAQARWKRWEMLTSGWHSMKVPCATKCNRSTWQKELDPLSSSLHKKPDYWENACWWHFACGAISAFQNLKRNVSSMSLAELLAHY